MAENWNRYGATAARTPAKKPGRETRPKSVTIDVHAHIAVPAADKPVRPHIDPSRIPFARHATPETRALNASQDADLLSRMTKYDERLKDLDAMGLDQQLIMCPPAQCYYTVPAEIAAPATKIVNEGIAEYVAGKPDRFIGLGSVTLQDGALAAKELEYCMKELKFKGVQILTSVDGKELSDPGIAPFWKKAEELGAVVLLHPAGFDATRLARHYFINVIGNPFDTTVALHYLIFDGVLERHPNLKIISVHGGGYLGAYSGRIDHVWAARSDAKGSISKPPTTYLKKIYVDTVVFTAHQLKALIEVFGADHVLLGTDYPYDMAEFDPIEHLVSSGLDASAVGAIAGGNAKKLLGL